MYTQGKQIARRKRQMTGARVGHETGVADSKDDAAPEHQDAEELLKPEPLNQNPQVPTLNTITMTPFPLILSLQSSKILSP